MSDSDDFTAMNDPGFPAEYDFMRDPTSEFDRRAGSIWASAGRG
jgi:hypothetical protein